MAGDGRAALQAIFRAAEAADLSSSEFRLWCIVRSMDGGSGCFASSGTLAEKLRMSISSVEKMRARLTKPQNGPWLELVHRGPKEPALRAVLPGGTTDQKEPDSSASPTTNSYPAKLPRQNGRYAYPQDFEAAWDAYPPRQGGNPKKAAYRAWRTRVVTDGVEPDDLLAGVKRYARYMEAAGKAGTEFVKHGATFFGPDEHWAGPYTLPGGDASASEGFAELEAVRMRELHAGTRRVDR